MQRTNNSVDKNDTNNIANHNNAEQKRDAALAIVSQFLDEKSQRELRTVSRGIRAAMQQVQVVPYKNKTAFATASSGLFHDPYLQSYLQSAWNYYSTIIQSSSMKPAVLYKLRDKEHCDGFDDKLWFFRQGEQIQLNGRQYHPENFCDESHCWAFNLVWMLANIHRGRAFVIFSELVEKNFHRNIRPDNYSAFARELTAAMIAGYILLTNIKDDLQLSPPDHPVKVQFCDLMWVDDDEISAQCHDLQLNAKKLQQGASPFPARIRDLDDLDDFDGTTTLTKRYR